MQEVPKSLIVIGCGAVGVEFDSVNSRFGADMTIVELLPQIVPMADEEVSKERERSFRKSVIKSLVGTEIEKLEKTANCVKVSGKTAKGLFIVFQPETLLVAVGRMHYTHGLFLES